MMRTQPLDGPADGTALSIPTPRRRNGRFNGSLMRVAAAVLIAATALVAGCKRDGGGQLPQASGEAIVVKREAVKGFALVAAYPDQKRGDELAIALEFSQPLVGTQDFDQLLAVTDKNGAAVEGGWVLDEGGKILRFPHVEASKDYTVTIKPGLTAAAGDRIGQALTKQVYTGPLEPVVGFASQGSVLPARDSRGLPVLKNLVDRMLRQRADVLAFHSAPTAQGGTGAVLVLLARRRR